LKVSEDISGFSTATPTERGSAKDLCVRSFGMAADLPVSGELGRDGHQQARRVFLDLNNNGKWEGPGVDVGMPAAGDVPVVGRR